MSQAARLGDVHTCSDSSHPGGVITRGCPTVVIGNQPAATLGDLCSCAGPTPIVQGEPTVLIAHRPAARLGDATGHGGLIASGEPTVFIGMSPQAGVLASAAEVGAPLCEECPGGG